MRKAALAFILSAVLGLSGCGSLLPPEPCSEAWFDREAREAFRPIRSDLAPTLRDLRALSEAKGKPGLVALWRTARALDNLASLIEAFERRSLPRLQAAANECKDPGFVRRAIFDFLEEEGIEDVVRDFEEFDRLMARAAPAA